MNFMYVGVCVFVYEYYFQLYISQYEGIQNLLDVVFIIISVNRERHGKNFFIT